MNRDFVSLPVKDGQQMKIGERTLRFMAVPNLHWPDTMYTFIEEEQILVTCDSFGAHYCLPEVLRSRVQNEQDYQKALKYYFDCIIGPFKPFMLRALDRVEPLDVTWCVPATALCWTAASARPSPSTASGPPLKNPTSKRP